MVEPRYLGDGVYATDEGYHLVLTTGSHLKDEADNIIYLDPTVIVSLIKYIKDKALHDNPTPTV